MGPFRPSKEGGLDLNPHSWNQRANMVFIESPEGVGFSQSDSSSTLYADDRSTAATNHKIILKFMERFPHFQSNDLYLASESYGGHYLPTLALELVQDISLNFKGFSVGNPFTTLDSGDYSFLSTAWGHQMIAEPTWTRYQKECKEASRINLEQCAALEIEMHIQIGKLNPYAIDFPSCVPSSAVQSDRLLRTLASSYELEGLQYTPEKTSPMFNVQGIKNKFEYEPCEDDYITRYLNRADVQRAIHASTDEDDFIAWSKCSRSLKYSHFDSQVSMVPIYKKLLSDPSIDVSLQIFSGSIIIIIAISSIFFSLHHHNRRLYVLVLRCVLFGLHSYKF
jgi:carboxypeptidase C (cathepsin A)